MRRVLFIILLLIAGGMAAKAQWGYGYGYGYNPYAAQFEMFQMQQMQQAMQILQQQQQMSQNYQFQAPPAAVNFNINSLLTPMPSTVPYTPVTTYDVTTSEYDKASTLNKTYGELCKVCKGTGKCHACHGTKIASSYGNTYHCNVCNDKGECGACDGTGVTSWNR